MKTILVIEINGLCAGILLKYVPVGPINYTLSHIQVMACRWTGDKPLP